LASGSKGLGGERDRKEDEQGTAVGVGRLARADPSECLCENPREQGERATGNASHDAPAMRPETRKANEGARKTQRDAGKGTVVL
jgi:hypothetical protein